MNSPTDQAVRLSINSARRAVLAHQGLYPPRSWKGKRGLKSFFQRVRSIQFDPINVVGRNPDLVLQSRVIDYKPDLLDELLYQDRYLIDGWDKMASLCLAEDWPYFTRHRARMEEQFGVPSQVVMKISPLVLKQIKEEGPQSSLDFNIKQKTDWAWGPTRVTRASLEGLYSMGQLGVHHRVRNRRYFDLIDNLLPEELLTAPDPHQDLDSYQRWHVQRRITSMGLAHPNAGEQWGGMIGIKSARRREILQKLTAEGKLALIEIEGLDGDEFYMRWEDLQLFQNEMPTQQKKAAAFIAPLDNLLWDRKNVERLFDFSYVWEVYKPKNKREFGYYVLPVLYGESFIGRVDPSFESAKRQLVINDWWWEKGVKVDQQMADALRECLKKFLKYLDGDEIKFSQNLLKKGDLDWLQEI